MCLCRVAEWVHHQQREDTPGGRSKGMELLTVAADLAAMSDVDRGAAIQARLQALGIGDREFQRETKIDRKTLNRAIANDPAVRESTYLAIEVALDRLERRSQGGVAVSERDLVTFRLSGNFGVEVTVQGPVSDMEALEAAVERLLRRMGDEPQTGTDQTKP